MNAFNDNLCPVCKASSMEVFFQLHDIPVWVNLLYSSQTEALNCSRDNIDLAFCPSCGFIKNQSFNQQCLSYDQKYENSLHFSATFNQYARDLARRLVEQHHLYNKTIIEIGCGKGDFLISLCQIGGNRGIGFDPSYIPLPEHQAFHNQIVFVQDYYSEKYAQEKCVFFCCRHTLEHISDPVKFLSMLRQTLRSTSDSVVFFEVPNALDIFHNLAIWDIIYEHCCYFTPVTLEYIFAISGFRTTKLTEEFNHQFLCLEALPLNSNSALTIQNPNKVLQLQTDINNFVFNYSKVINYWKHRLNQMFDQGKRVVVWGAGSKGVTFLNCLQIRDLIEYVVDINPRKHGRYIAGTGQKIVPPLFLENYQPEVIIIMNSNYKQEIKNLVDGFGFNPQFLDFKATTSH